MWDSNETTSFNLENVIAVISVITFGQNRRNFLKVKYNDLYFYLSTSAVTSKIPEEIIWCIVSGATYII